jgi:hypothetical protein
LPRLGFYWVQIKWVALISLHSHQMPIIIQIQSNFCPILLILSCLFLDLVIKHWLINSLSMFITTFLLISLPFILSKSNTILAKLYTNIDFQHLQKKKKQATLGFEPRIACMLNWSATPRPRGEVEFKGKKLYTI